MKGAVFNLLNELVEEKFGYAAWEHMLQIADCDGVFVSSETYADDLLVSLVAAAHEQTQVSVRDLLFSFGQFMAPAFARDYPVFFENQTSLKAFLLTVDRTIHVEVRKLYPEAHLPEFDYKDEADNRLTMIYTSPRKLCALAEGLIQGSAEHFSERYELEHRICMHAGNDHCELQLTFLGHSD